MALPARTGLAGGPRPSGTIAVPRYIWVLVALIGAGLLWRPIVYPDADLWFHLSSGRYIVEHGFPPRDSYFSFISPPRPWTDYFWLFQVLAYLIHQGGGYFALLLLRMVVYLALIIVLIRYLFRQPQPAGAACWLTVMAALYSLFLIPRYLLVRPHMFTYLLIAVFLYILEFHPRRAFLLPVLAVFWCNVHGAVYPVMLAITGSYALEHLVERWRGRPYDALEERRFFVPTVLSMASVYATPLGTQLLPVPFRPLGFQSAVTAELLPFPLEQLLSLHLASLVPSLLTLFTVFFWLACVAAVRGWMQRRLRLSHVLLFLTGLFLLPKAYRFSYEFALLALPLVRSHPIVTAGRPFNWLPKPAAVMVTWLLMAVPLCTIKDILNVQGALGVRGTYPFSRTGLPDGVVTFLRHVGASGRVLNRPDPGGYLRWELYPSYTLFMDMEVFFLDEDFFVGWGYYADRQILRSVIARYHPSFITVPWGAAKFPELIREFPEYVPVFFDDAEVLYVQREHFPEIARRYELTAIRPFEFFTYEGPFTTRLFETAEAFEEIRRLLSVYPAAGGANYAVASRFIEDKAYDRVLPYADAIIRAYPEFAAGYLLKGGALRGMGRLKPAAECYRAALRRTAPGYRGPVYQKLGQVYLEDERPRPAYRMLKKGTDGIALNTTVEELYLLGISALKAGQSRHAKFILTFLQDYRLAPEDRELRERVESTLKLIEQGGADAAKRLPSAPTDIPTGTSR